MPLIQAGSDIWTYSDLVAYVLDAHEIDRTGLNERRARAAVLKAYRDLPYRHDWSYYYRQRLLQTVASYSTGTCVYDHSGGASERLITLTSGTFPSWAAFGRIIIDSVHYEVDTYESSTTLTLREDSNPGSDLSSSSYELYRSAYPLPSDFRRLCRLWDVEQQRGVAMVDQHEQHTALQIFYDTPDTPWQATIRAVRDYYAQKHLVFGPPPSTIRTYDILYEAAPRQLSIDEYSAGTVVITADDATVTLTSGTFPTNCVGSVIRFSSSATPPSNHLGSLDNTDNPFVEQGVIKSRTSSTAVELEAVASQSLSGVAYVISDPLDIAPGPMLTALMHAAEAEFCQRAGRKDTMQKMQLAHQSLIHAMEADRDSVNDNRRHLYDPFKHGTESTSA
jgi:hypothetical protein